MHPGQKDSQLCGLRAQVTLRPPSGAVSRPREVSGTWNCTTGNPVTHVRGETNRSQSSGPSTFRWLRLPCTAPSAPQDM
ncbi:rCG37244 [Rattus norvegicus]|uniref:RCG37244 n=1 Tax=Rattus norvegicus TaxID=10116 RepID=A6KHF8_RAT|nr:rCG37244 [Rattus norvegicus]